MIKLKEEWIEKIYAGWLSKIIGIRLGAPIEGWTYEQIKDIYGAITDYPVAYNRFAADDDSNGPLFFLRALEKSMSENRVMTADDVGEALLNYAPYEHGFFWWGGYGCSTEHTAYLNLRQGIPAPESGSIRQNGSTMAEQIGGQIFIDTWGLVAPGNPALAAELAAKAASVTHDGNGVYGGIFVAVCISTAFVEKDIWKILKTGLSYIPENSAYARLVKEIMLFYQKNPKDWEKCFAYIHEHHGYDKYPGNCHILPNIAVMILSLLYGEGDFSRTITICNRCGWDTDCNVGNVATIMGVRGGLNVIEEKWRLPVNDFLACSSVVGSLNIQDIPYGACYIARLAWKLAGEELPQKYKEIIENRIHSCHFEFPGSTHAIEVRREEPDKGSCQKLEYHLRNTDETARSGERSLQINTYPTRAGEKIFIYKRTYLYPSDFHDSRYDPAFSPILYPGQIVHGSIMVPDGEPDCKVSLYVRNARTGEIFKEEGVIPAKGEWIDLTYQIPAMKGALLDEAGYVVEILPSKGDPDRMKLYIDDFYMEGNPDYEIDFSKEVIEYWTPVHREISQFTRLKGNLYLENKKLHLTCADFGEAYTGDCEWKDYAVTFQVQPLAGKEHYCGVRVQGGVRGYYVGFSDEREFVIFKNTRNGMNRLAAMPFISEIGKEYEVHVTVTGNKIKAEVEQIVLEAEDKDTPYLTGAIGIAVRKGSHISCSSIRIGRTGSKISRIS